MIGVAALVLALVMASAAVAYASGRDALGRAGCIATPRTHTIPRLPTPDPSWRGWPALGAIGGWVLGGPLVAALGAIVAFVTSASLRRRLEAARITAIDEHLADAVRALSAGMRAGLSVPQAIAYVSSEGTPPLSEAFGKIVDDVALGGQLSVSLADWAERVGSDDARLVVGVLGLHRRTGGDLPRVLDQVAATLRERIAAAREVRSLTAQARLSGAILGLLPIGFFAFLWVTSRAQIEGAFRSPIGIGAIVLGLGLEAIAFLWIRKLLEVA